MTVMDDYAQLLKHFEVLADGLTTPSLHSQEDRFTTTEEEAAKWERDHFAEPPERPDPSEYEDRTESEDEDDEC